MRRFWFLFAAASSFMTLGACPNAAADSCLHGIYIDPQDLKAYACPWGGGMIHTTHGDVYADMGGIVVPDSAFAYGAPDDGSGNDDAGDDNGDSGE